MSMNPDEFLNYLCNHKETVTVFLQCGVKLQGVLVGMDVSSILVEREGHVQLIYKHSISTIMPFGAISNFDSNFNK